MQLSHAREVQLIQTQRGGLLTKTGGAEVPPDAHSITGGPEVQPAVVVMVNGDKLAHSRLSQEFDALAGVEAHRNLPVSSDSKIGPKIVIEVTTANDCTLYPVCHLASDEGPAPLFFQQ